MNFDKLCRLCAKERLRLVNIIDIKQNTIKLADQIRNILHIQYEENDGLPQKICKLCVSTVQNIQETLDEYHENDSILRHQIFGVDETEVKIEELHNGAVICEIQEVKIEPLPCDFVLSNTDSLKKIEEWLKEEEDNIIFKSKEINEHQNKNKTFVEKSTSTQVKLLSKKNKHISQEKEEFIKKRLPCVKVESHRPRMNDYKCYICKSNTLGSAKNLLDHLNIHNEQLPYICPICVHETIEIKQIRSLNLHLKMHEQPIKCEYCDRRYGNGRARDYHVQAFHLGANAPCPSTCDICGKVCPSLLSLRTHRRRHTISFKCEYCARGFSERSKLKRHIVRVHEKTEGYICSICHKRLNTIDAYELHVRTIHENRRDYPCEICGRRFTTAAFLRMHQKHYEDSICKPKKSWTSFYTMSVNRDGIKLYQCKVCKKENMRSIGEHMRTHFPDEYECPVCQAKFPRKSSFDRHRRTHKEIVHACFTCDKCFLNPQKLQKHLAKEHGIGHIVDIVKFPVTSDEEVDFNVK